MYITITAQKLTTGYAQSVADFVDYLEKENEGIPKSEQEHFFNQTKEGVFKSEVVKAIDANTYRLKQNEPKFYSITVNPSNVELKGLKNKSEDLKLYTREFMKDYAASFNRELNGRSVSVDDIVYFAKIEHQRDYKGTDKQVIENAPYRKEIRKLENDLQKIKRGTLQADPSKVKQQIKELVEKAPHKINGKLVEQGMPKEGSQNHIHIIVSRMDASNRHSLSPGSKYKSADVEIKGTLVKRGFDRDHFYKSAEKTFDRSFGYKRNYVESYQARKEYIKSPKNYFALIMGLPGNEKSAALKILQKSGLKIPNIPTNKVQFIRSVIKGLKKGVDLAVKSSSLGI